MLAVIDPGRFLVAYTTETDFEKLIGVIDPGHFRVAYTADT